MTTTQVSMKSGLGDRNNERRKIMEIRNHTVSMKSGLGDRNNLRVVTRAVTEPARVSMKSGLGDRNNEAGSDVR